MLAAASLELKAEKQSAHSGWVSSVAFSPDGKTIVSGSSDKTLKVWDAGASALIPSNPKPRPDRPGACGSFPGPQGREAERAQQLRDLRGLLTRRQDHRLGLLRPDAQSLGCGCVTTACPSACQTDQPYQPSPTASLELKATKENAHNGYVMSVGYNSDGDKIVSGGQDGTLKVWDAGTSTAGTPPPDSPLDTPTPTPMQRA